MLSRQVAIGARPLAGPWSRGLATLSAAKTVERTLPSVKDYTVTVHLVDYKGAHSKIVGRVGQTLMQATTQYGGPGAKVLEDDSGGGGGRNERINSDRWTEMVFGEGAQSYQSHVRALLGAALQNND